MASIQGSNFQSHAPLKVRTQGSILLEAHILGWRPMIGTIHFKFNFDHSRTGGRTSAVLPPQFFLTNFQSFVFVGGMATVIRSDITFFPTAEGGDAGSRVAITSIEQLREILTGLAQGEPRMVRFESGMQDVLHLGIGSECACAHFTTGAGKLRHLCAKPQTMGAGEDAECACGWTPTCVPAELCLSFEEAVKIAEHFLVTGAYDPGFDWVEE